MRGMCPLFIEKTCGHSGVPLQSSLDPHLRNAGQMIAGLVMMFSMKNNVDMLKLLKGGSRKLSI